MKILALILAAGEGSRIKPFLDEDEQIKPMLRVGDKRLIEVALDSLEGIDVERAVLTFPGEQYRALSDLVQGRGVRTLTQKALHLKLPTMLELPYLLLTQYHFSRDRKWLQSFDAILTLPCDLIFTPSDLAEVLRMHQEEALPSLPHRITLLSKIRDEGESSHIFQLDGSRIMQFESFRGATPVHWIRTHQAGIYCFSKALIKNPLIFFHGLKRFHGQMYVTENKWNDYGNAESVKALKGID